MAAREAEAVRDQAEGAGVCRGGPGQRDEQGRGAKVQFRGLLLTLPANELPGGTWEQELRHRFGPYLLPQTIPYDTEVGKDPTHPSVCARCAKVLRAGAGA